MKNIYIIVAIAAAAIAGTTIYSQSQKTGPKTMEKTDSAMMMKDDAMMEKNHGGDAMMKKDDAMMMKDDAMMEKTDSAMMKKDDAMMMKSGAYTKYEDTKLAELTGNIVLDFSAPWCPSCVSFKKSVEANLEAIPSDLNLVVVDYDSNVALRKKYGVTSQHTFVQVDQAGNKIALWRGGRDLASVVKNIK